MTQIEVFAVPPAEDDAFLAAWREEPRTAVLYRALRDDADFRYAAIGEGGPYAVVREDGVPDTEGGCVLIDPFEVPDNEDERFLAGWEAARAALADARGYLGSRLHHSPEADFRFVNVARWSSPLMLQRATQRPGFPAAAAAIPYRSHQALYQPVA